MCKCADICSESTDGECCKHCLLANVEDDAEPEVVWSAGDEPAMNGGW